MDSNDIQKLARLAKLQISEQTINATAVSINQILGLVDQLQEVDTSMVSPMAHPLDAQQRLRADSVSESNAREKYQAIAPAVEDGLYLVPKVLD